MLELLRHPEGVMVATWDLSAGKKDGIHIRMWYHKVCQQTLDVRTNCCSNHWVLSWQINYLCQIIKFKFRGLSGTILYKQHSQDNSSLTSSTKCRPPKQSQGALHIHMLQAPWCASRHFTCTLCCHVVWTLNLEAVQPCLQTSTLNQQPTIGKSSHTVPAVLSQADLPPMAAAASGLSGLHLSKASAGSGWRGARGYGKPLLPWHRTQERQ